MGHVASAAVVVPGSGAGMGQGRDGTTHRSHTSDVTVSKAIQVFCLT